MTTKEFAKILQDKLTSEYGVDLSVASHQQIYRALALICRQMMSENHKKFQSKAIGTGSKQVYYLCMEFLMGRSLKMSLFNLGLNDAAQKALAEADISLDSIYEEEPDAGLGNGGLGRLAACYLDGMATTSICGTGYSILYEYGIFKQKIVDGWQQERADNWLPGGQVWLKSHPDQAVEVRFDGEIHENWDHGFHYIQHTNYNSVMAIPSDMYVQGYDGKGVAKLRLWQAKAPDFDMSSFSLGNYNTAMSKNASAELISKVLYPNDNHVEGKILRLRQQYFLSAASIGDIVQNHLSTYGTLENLPDKVAIQLNDTHPVLCIPELMRILMDDYKYDWDQAWDITKNTMAYTNHTVLSEALEKWPIQYVQDLLPRVFMIIEEIDRRFKYEVSHDMGRSDLMNECCVLKDGQVHMANLAIIGSHSVNGVAALHTKILKEDVMKNFHDIYPNKFNNKTNGITHRRWLLYSNPQLSNLLEKTIGPDFKANPERLQDLMKYVDDKDLQKEFMDVKMERKKILAAYIKDTLHIDIDVNSIFDVQAKRLHAYKRQLLNVMNIIDLYFRMKQDPSFRIYPRTFIFAAKAAPSYTFAKEVIKLIHYVADKVNNDSDVSPYMKVVFIPNYGVSIAEILMNAADVSEQISTAGKEASGTGNMKFMMNGAITLGTMDGANVEIVEKVGYDHAEIFGLRADDVALVKHENTYDVWRKYNENANIQKVVNSFVDSTFSNDPKDFKQIYNELMFKNDEYLLLADYRAYCDAERRMAETYENREQWNCMSLLNIARSGSFAADRAVAEYADNIWHVPHR